MFSPGAEPPGRCVYSVVNACIANRPLISKIGAKLEGKFLQKVDHLLLLAAGEGVMERQPDELVADAFGNGAITRFSAKIPAHIGEVQGQIMEYTIKSMLAQISNQLLP